MYAEENNLPKAIDIIIAGIESQPLNHDLYYRLAGYLIKKGRHKEAYENFEIALKMNFPDHIQLFEYYPELQNEHQLQLLINIYSNPAV